MEILNTDFAPPATGHYSQGVRTESKPLIFTSMQLPLSDDGSDNLDKSLDEQMQILVKNVVDIVRSGGGNEYTLLKVTLYLTDIALWDQINDAYKKAIGTHKPALSVLHIGSIQKGYKIAMEAIGETL